MFSIELVFLVRQEQLKDQLRELKRQNLVRIATAQQRDDDGLLIKAVNGLGRQMVKWGVKLQNYAPTARSTKLYQQIGQN
jgi:hypothetical protein